MFKHTTIAVIIPALNEAESLPGVLSTIPDYVDRVIVADNGSGDGTYDIAANGGYHPRVTAVKEPRRGYGSACLRAMQELDDEQIVVFLDADHSDDPRLMNRLLDPIISGEVDGVLANRFTPQMEPGALSWPQYLGNKLAVLLVRLLWGVRYRDLGPFRAVRRDVLTGLQMSDPNYGWTIELQVKAAARGLRITEVDLPYRNRSRGKSKVSGTIKGVVLAGYKILWTIAKYKLRHIRGQG